MKKKDNANNSSIIGNNVCITGTIQADSGEVVIQGSVDGDIDCHVANIKKSGTVKGSIKAKQLCVEGKAEGEFNIDEMLHIKTEGRIDGKITYGGIKCDGGLLSGEVKHDESNKIKQEEFKDLKVLCR